MAVVFGAVVPHGWPLIPELSDDAESALRTRAALEEVSRRVAAQRPEVVVIATPHGVRVAGAVCLAAVARGAGALHYQGRTFELNVPVDVALTEAIAAVAQARGVPVALAGFAGNLRAESTIPLDWGTMVPLRFLGHATNLVGLGDVLADEPTEETGPPVVVVTPGRDLPRRQLIDFGEAVAEAAERDGRRVAVVASCDWSHTHPGGRYGEDSAAGEVDAAVVAALRDGDPARLIDLDPALTERASIDGLWQLLILAGALRRRPMGAEVLSYEAPPKYATGMIVAALTP